MQNEILGYTEEKLKNLSEDIITQSKKLGAESVEVEISISSGKNLTVRNEDIETFEINNDKNITLTLYKDGRKSVVSSSDFSKKTIEHLIGNSLNMLKVTELDPYFGIVEKDLHPKQLRSVDIFYPQEFSFDELLQIAKQAESSAKSFDDRITNSEGTTINCSSSIFMYANSNNFFGGFPGSRYSLYCSVIGSKNQAMQRSYDYSNVRDFRDLKNPTHLGERAAKNTIDRLNVKKIKTGNYPIIFHNTISDAVINPILSAISGRNLYRQNSFLLDTIGTKIASDRLTIKERPLLSKGHASTYFDDEGVEVFDNTLVDCGVLNRYLLSNYSAKKLNLLTTGNAGGTHNLIFQHHNISLDRMIKDIKKGFLITELLGHGVNMVNGDFSRGAAGLYIENGEIQHAVEEITIAGNLKDMAMNIESIADDTNTNSSKYIGSVLIKKMAVGAS